MTKLFSYWVVSAACIWVLSAGFSPLLTAHSQSEAQSATTVSILPADSTLYLNLENQGEIAIHITDGVDINAFDVIVTYDSSILTIESWTYGDFLSNVMPVVKSDQPGRFRLAATQRDTPGANGNGSLFTLKFSGVSLGRSEITISKAELSNKNDQLILPNIVGGTITTAYDPALLDQYAVTGEIVMQGQQARSGISVTLSFGASYQIGPYTAVSLGQPGTNLLFGDVVADTYLIITNQPRYLNLTPDLGKTITITAGSTTLTPMRLLAGNAVWSDNVINAGDASLVGASFGRTTADLQPGETLDADVNFDGVVDLRDLALVAGNFDMTSESAYETWVP